MTEKLFGALQGSVLCRVFFNIFSTDLFYILNITEIANYEHHRKNLQKLCLDLMKSAICPIIFVKR